MTGNANSGNHRFHRLKPARGNVKGTANGSYKQLSISFPPDMFDDIRNRAIREGISFAEIVRRYCEWGLENELVRKRLEKDSDELSRLKWPDTTGQ